MEIVARSAAKADGREPASDDVVAQGETAAERFLLRWRGEADPRHVKAIDTYWICTAEHGLNASTFTARVVASTGADCGAALSSAVGRALRPAARWRARVREADARRGPGARRPERWVREALESGKRIMGFGHRVYRAEDPRSRILKRTAKELDAPQVEIAEQLEAVALKALQERHPERVLATNVEYYSAVVLDVAEIPPPLAPAMFACSRVAGWSAHILEQKRTGRLFRPSARVTSVPPSDRFTSGLSLAEAGVEANALAESGNERDLAKLRAAWAEELEAQARSENHLERAAAYRAVGQFRFRQKEELLRRGLEDVSPACRGSALLSLELLSREHPRSVNSVRPLLHNLANADDNEAVRRLAILALRNGSPQRDTIVLLQGIAEEEGISQETRQTAAKVAAGLDKRAKTR